MAILLKLLYILLPISCFQAYRLDKSSHYMHPKYRRLAGPSGYNCHGLGKFEDISSYNSYWKCDPSPNGGYIATRRTCPLGYIFSSEVHDCVSKNGKRCGDVCEDNNEGKVSYIVVVTEEATYPDTSEGPTTPSCSSTTSVCPKRTTPKPDCFKCSCEGVFADPMCNTSFYICHRKKGGKGQFEKIKVNCPEGMAFDSKAGWCSNSVKRSIDLDKKIQEPT